MTENNIELTHPALSAPLDMFFCQSCGMPMTKQEDFSDSRDYCKHCCTGGILRNGVTIYVLSENVQKLIDIEVAYPDLLSTPLFNFIKQWITLDNAEKKELIPVLLSTLIDGQDCDFTGTRWEKEWLADGKVCHCIACIAARKCISDIKLLWNDCK